MKTQIKHISKLMSLILRHNPQVIGAELDENGWIPTEILLAGIRKKGIRIDHDLLDEVVETNNKKRFAFNADKTKIRASQGHSVKVDVELKEETPPEILYHGTVNKFLDTIKEQGLIPMNRLHVHLSKDLETATNVGSRRGKPIILKIMAREMIQDGYTFYLSENGVWLTDKVLPEYIKQ
ncbi:MAG: RNA 2'-phosphotransferase [Crocinitomicaceae bacterium]|nr:RNA 2'-phosphotransferase [Crocinitomicaceae bacterium]